MSEEDFSAAWDDESDTLDNEAVNVDEVDGDPEIDKPEVIDEGEAATHDDAGEVTPDPVKDDLPDWEQKYKSFEGRYRVEREGSDAKVKTLEAELEKLRSQGGQQTKPEEATQGSSAISADFANDYPEIAEQLRSFAEFQDKNFQDTLSQRISPVEQEITNRAQQEHIGAIKRVHADMSELVDSGKVKDWIDSVSAQDPLLADSYMNAYSQGTPEQVINLLNGYKSNLTAQETRKKETVRDEALAATAVRSRPSGAIPKGKPNKNDFDAAWDED